MKDANRDYLGRHVLVRVVQISRTRDWIWSIEDALNEQDRSRADRFRIPEDRLRFFAGRALLRSTLQECGESSAPVLELTLTSRGRPILANYPEIQFSLSHSGDFVGLALTIQNAVGIDLEAIDRAIRLPELIERIFSSEDLEAFRRLSADDAVNAFFRAWTGKEAYLKARGVGISEGLKEVVVPLEAAASSAPHTFRPEGKGGASWCLQALPLPPGYLGHVVWSDSQKCLDFRVVNPTAG
jgi:4'-phosphopantetheinyl transferase